jgi:hypothetical protein
MAFTSSSAGTQARRFRLATRIGDGVVQARGDLIKSLFRDGPTSSDG